MVKKKKRDSFGVSIELYFFIYIYILYSTVIVQFYTFYILFSTHVYTIYISIYIVYNII